MGAGVTSALFESTQKTAVTRREVFELKREAIKQCTRVELALLLRVHEPGGKY